MVYRGKSLVDANEAIAISKEISYPSGVVSGLRARGWAESVFGKPDDAIKSFSEALNICDVNNLRKMQAKLHEGIASAYDDKGDYRKAIEHYEIALCDHYN